ncbi:GlcG/HbpS family heme-binding protein [Brevundimonas bacteroides]|uniref:GlcG/HbpS family heme-binding protein n=1 Tax=Brevundimonas bacteroides TaxID=74311 RepID=UPI000497C918|nr:heme-binding protein [Brevundimonas bacteroides]
MTKALATALCLGLTLALVAAPTARTQTMAPAAASTPPAPAPAYGAPIALESAQGLITAALDHARANGWRVAVAVVEPSGELVAFARLDDTQYGSIHVSQRKASTAARYRIPTLTMEERVLTGRIVSLANEDTLPIAGGRPIIIDGRVVGAIGVSGVTSTQDDEVALAALATIGD